MYDIVILTDSRYEKPEKIDWYINQVIQEDTILLEALKEKGCTVIRKSWDAQDFDWTSCNYAIFRTTWDYFDRYVEFFSWFEKTQKILHFINPPELIYWNLDKHYLTDLKQQQINIPPTLFLEKGTQENLKTLLEEKGWQKAVLKPAIGGGGRETFKITKHNATEHQVHFEKLLAQEALLFQEFQDHIISQGEISLMMMNGIYTHAVLKKAKSGDFRVQDDFGGSVKKYTAKKEEIDFAAKAISACPLPPLYARVDVFYDNSNCLALGELELIEPELWFRNHPQAAALLAEAVVNYMNTKHR